MIGFHAFHKNLHDKYTKFLYQALLAIGAIGVHPRDEDK